MNLRSPIFRKLLLSAFLLIIATLGVLDFYLTRYAARREAQNVEQRLAAQARILSAQLVESAPADLEAWAKRVAQAAGARITIIGPGGKVEADSGHLPENMENHAGRPEVHEALTGRTGSSIRRSETLAQDLCYVAVPVRLKDNRVHALRLAVPLREVDDAIAAVRWRILSASVLAAALAMAIAYGFSRSLSRRIRRLQAFAQGLLNARYLEPLDNAAHDELGALAGSLSAMAAQMHETMNKLTLESARREAILGSMVEGVLVVDTELCVTFCNASFARSVGATLPVPERIPLLELVRDARLLEIISRVLVTGQTRKQVVQIPSGTGRSYEVHAAPLEVRSRHGAVAVLHDITDIERLERVRKDFVANVSHEFRTPLAAIRGYAETLLEGAVEDAENRLRFLEIIRAQAMRLNSIASDLLTLSELESADPQSAPERVSIRAALDAALSTVLPESSIRGVALHPGPIDDAFVMGNPIRLEQAFTNLLGNAVKFNRPGGEVRVSAARTDGQVEVIVSDTGVGIPSQDLPRIFERFYRVDKARSREVGGTGLGLSIVKHVVERMSGRIMVDSELGKGSTFTLILPAAR